MNIPRTLAGTPVNQFPVKEFVDVVVFLRTAADTVYDVTRPESAGGGKIVIAEYLSFLKTISTLKEALVGIGKVPEELSDTITVEEREQIASEILKAKYFESDELIQDAIDDVIEWLTVTQKIFTKWVFKTKDNVTA